MLPFGEFDWLYFCAISPPRPPMSHTGSKAKTLKCKHYFVHYLMRLNLKKCERNHTKIEVLNWFQLRTQKI